MRSSRASCVPFLSLRRLIWIHPVTRPPGGPKLASACHTEGSGGVPGGVIPRWRGPPELGNVPPGPPRSLGMARRSQLWPTGRPCYGVVPSKTNHVFCEAGNICVSLRTCATFILTPPFLNWRSMVQMPLRSSLPSPRGRPTTGNPMFNYEMCLNNYGFQKRRVY